MNKISVYGSRLCPDTVEALDRLERESIDHEYFDITEDLANLKAFLVYRDTNAAYDAVRGSGGIGIPLFIVGEDGSRLVTLDIDKALKHI